MGGGGRFQAGWELELFLNDAEGICRVWVPEQYKVHVLLNQLPVDIAYSASETPHPPPKRTSSHSSGLVNPIESGGRLGLSQGLPSRPATLPQASNAGAGLWLAWVKDKHNECKLSPAGIHHLILESTGVSFLDTGWTPNDLLKDLGLLSIADGEAEEYTHPPKQSRRQHSPPEERIYTFNTCISRPIAITNHSPGPVECPVFNVIEFI